MSDASGRRVVHTIPPRDPARRGSVPCWQSVHSTPVPVHLHLLSDLHLRHHPPPSLSRPSLGDVVVLAGDIHRGTKGVAWARATFPETPVVYVPGNHEYYDRFLDTTRPALRAAGDPLPSAHEAAPPPTDGVYVLERDAVVIGDVRILGCTFWTDFRLFEGQRARAVAACRANMDDYRRIRHLRARRPLRPRDTARHHAASVRWLRRQLAESPDGVRTTIVVTHHAPARWSVDPRYLEAPTSAAFVARRGPLVEQSGAVLWAHGHVHAPFDYRLGRTRVVSNPRGHDGENPRFRPHYTVEV